MNKIIVCGSNGQLGTEVIKIINDKRSEIGELPEFYNDCEVKGADVDELDITDMDSVLEFLEEQKPYAVINCAAMTNVDGCEQLSESALKVNAVGPRNLAVGCKKTGAKLVHISTDYIFSGDASVPYKETDIPNPKSVYGATKLLGEEYVKSFGDRWFIVRTAWLYGYCGNNFVKTIVKKARQSGRLEVVDDQRGNPTNAVDLAHSILKLIPTEEYGIYNCTGVGECSWYEFACEIVKTFGINAKVKPCSTAESNRAAKRPSYSSLDNEMLRITVGDDTRDWKTALKTFSEKVKID